MELGALPFPFDEEWNLPSSLPAEFPTDAEELVAEDEDAEDWELLPGGGLELIFPWSCMERKYFVAACLSCSRSSAVCLLKIEDFFIIDFKIFFSTLNTIDFSLDVFDFIWILPPFCSTILKPSFHLSVRHFQVFSQSCPFCRCQIFLLVKPFFQFTNLKTRERGSWLFPFRWSSILIWMTNSSTCYCC